MGWLRPKSRSQDESETRIPDSWKRVIKENEADGKTIHVKAKARRCALCENYDFTYPISIYVCERCLTRAWELRAEVGFNTSSAITHRPCFYCGNHDGLMKKINSHACRKCIMQISKGQRKIR